MTTTESNSCVLEIISSGLLVKLTHLKVLKSSHSASKRSLIGTVNHCSLPILSKLVSLFGKDYIRIMEQDNKNQSDQAPVQDLNKSVGRGTLEQSPPPKSETEGKETISQPNPPSLFQKYRKWIIVISTFLVLVAIGIGAYFSLTKRGEETTSGPISKVSPSPTTAQIVDKRESSAEIQYQDREKVFDTVKLQRNSDIEATAGEDWELDIYDFYKVGTITSGKYKDGDLLLVLYKAGGPCKGRGCGKPKRLRYIRKDNQAVFLPRISSIEKLGYSGSSESDLRQINPFKEFGMTLVYDNEFTIPALEYTEVIVGNNPAQRLTNKYNAEGDGRVNEEILVSVFDHEIFGTVYTTKPEVAPSESFYGPGPGLVVVPNDTSVAGCEGESCFYTNAFYVFRQDGTFLKYSYDLPFSEKDVQWNDNTTPEDDYVSQTVSGCSREPYDYVSVVSTETVKEGDLLPIGKIATTGVVVYGLKDDNHSLYAEFYEEYSQKIPEWYGDMTGFEIDTKTYSEFLSSRPLFLWKDPFGRVIRFSNSAFLPPWACEPIIYLYPEVEQEIQVRIGDDVSISDSMPNYARGWNVIANTKGEITNLSDGRTYPYLFWEGFSYTFSLKEEGFVIKQEEVEKFFSDVLPKLGLYETETEDFIEAWKPYFSGSPYYFITFIDQEVTNKIAPLQITPKPDTVIRILMDYKPLDNMMVVSDFDLPIPPDREGFTVVEWGGLRREY